MLEDLKKVDLIEEMDQHMRADEDDIFVECRPNKFPFITRYMVMPTFAIVIYICLLLLHVFLIRTFEKSLLLQLADTGFIFLGIFVLGFTFYEIYKGFVASNHTYYVITANGVHMLYWTKSMEYAFIQYSDLKSVIIKKRFGSMGDIYIKEITDEPPKEFLKRILQQKKGLICIDEVEKVFEVLKQIASQENDNIFFANAKSDLVENDYFRDVKKYDNKLNVKKDDSLISRRSN